MVVKEVSATLSERKAAGWVPHNVSIINFGRQDPLEAILVIFGRRALNFFFV